MSRSYVLCSSLLCLGLVANASAQQFGFAPAIDQQQAVATAQRMAERVRILSEDARAALGGMPGAQYLAQDAAELAQSLDDFGRRASTNGDPNGLRQQYRSINIAWKSMRGQLLRPTAGLGPAPGIDRSVARVDELDSQLVGLLGLNPTPNDFYGQGPAPSGMNETRRLAHALADRSMALSSTIRVEMIRAPNGNLLVREADDLARAADAFHDAIDANTIQPDAVPAQLGQIVSISDAMRRDYGAVRLTPNVNNQWLAYQSAESLLRQQFNMGPPVIVNPNPPQILPPIVIPSPLPRLIPYADQLITQVDAFLRVFSGTANRVPEGRQFLDEATRLRNAAINFRNAIGGGADPGRLAFQFREVDDCFQRLARRTNRIAQGRSGPNIQQIQLMGQSCAAIHQLLGMPGFPAQLPGFTFP